MQNVTMILEGGATRGVFTSGVLDFLMEKEWYPSHVIGVSAGSPAMQWIMCRSSRDVRETV